MKPQERYRFKTLNACDYSQAYFGISSSIFITTNIEIGAHVIEVGDTVFLEDFDPKINGFHNVVAITPTHISIDIGILHDITMMGVVYRLTPRYVSPLNFLSTKFIWEGIGVRWRKKLSGKLKFTGADYNYFLPYLDNNTCCELKFIIEKRCDSAWSTEWNGYFSMNMGTWNLSQCNVEFEFLSDDRYRCLERGKTKKHNIALYNYTDPVNAPYEILFEETTCCFEGIDFTFVGTNGQGCPMPPFAYPGNDENVKCGLDMDFWQLKRRLISNWNGLAPPFGLADVCSTWVREITTTLDTGGLPTFPAGTGWVENGSTTLAGLPAHNWYRAPFDNAFGDSSYYSTLYGDQGQENPSACDITVLWNNPATNDEYTRGHLFSDVFTRIVADTCPKIVGVRSDFFEMNPPGDTPGYVPNTNYVTGDSPNKVKNMALFQKSDFINPTATEPATVAEITFDQFIKQICEIFWLDWFIDSVGFLRIEHLSWFNRVATKDTTIGESERLNRGQKLFSFERESIPVIEEYKFMEQSNYDFVGKPITYPPACPDETFTKSHDVPSITTDTSFIQNNPDEIANDGFVLIVLDPDDTSVIDQEIGFLTGLLKNNAHLSWANLHEAYHRDKRPLIIGNMNGDNTTFNSAVPSKLQEDIKLVECCGTIEPMTDLITTELGDGQIVKMEKSVRDEVFSFNLLF